MTCQHCYKFLEIQDDKAANMWIEFINFFRASRSLIKFREDRTEWALPACRLLEKHGFISTCDYNDGVLVRVNGHHTMTSNNRKYEAFCMDYKRHCPSMEKYDSV